jgi:hypothetical protein
LTVVPFLVVARRIQKLELITWQDDAIESVRVGSLFAALLQRRAAIRRNCACNVASPRCGLSG